MTDRRNPEDHIPLAPHVFQILLSLLDQDLHGYAILKDVEERTGGEMTLGTSTVYAAIKRMHREGILEDAPDPVEETSDGPRRKYFRITSFGREVARQEGLRITRLNRMIGETSLLGLAGDPLSGGGDR